MSKRRKRKKKVTKYQISISIIILLLIGYINYYKQDISTFLNPFISTPSTSYAIETIPPYNGEPYITINNNIPNFTEKDYTTTSYETYSELDVLGRCGSAMASIGQDLMPTTERGSIGMIKPSGWHTIKYDNIEGKYLYNRCHLIGFQLTGETTNEKNLITCTRYMNTKGMLPFENKVAAYIKNTNNHVLYRVTPIFNGTNLLASGVQMEAYSIEDNGKGIEFNVFVYNVQNGININYSNGESKLENKKVPTTN